MAKSRQLSFVIDAETVELIEGLKKDLKAPTAAAVFRKALSIARLACDLSKDSNGIVTMRGQGQPADTEVSLSLRS